MENRMTEGLVMDVRIIEVALVAQTTEGLILANLITEGARCATQSDDQTTEDVGNLF